jgi:hypothetical protein
VRRYRCRALWLLLRLRGSASCARDRARAIHGITINSDIFITFRRFLRFAGDFALRRHGEMLVPRFRATLRFT